MFTTTDGGIAAAVVIVVAILLYRLLRREPFDRIVRLGLFVERQRYEPPLDDQDEPADPDATVEWPRQDPPFDP